MMHATTQKTSFGGECQVLNNYIAVTHRTQTQYTLYFTTFVSNIFFHLSLNALAKSSVEDACGIDLPFIAKSHHAPSFPLFTSFKYSYNIRLFISAIYIASLYSEG
eukprot:TRINITY_DN2979_c1_g1_i2.p3 TRINITY_DN2979_c1_g1~~TRINITY_DN2979_c1_g1_i2.p3  ORF type:complete len:106 (+),score=3.84 TRINITY_DN2979_c1_g1_i2:80-397(+)